MKSFAKMKTFLKTTFIPKSFAKKVFQKQNFTKSEQLFAYFFFL
jgi:hypothetical protein